MDIKDMMRATEHNPDSKDGGVSQDVFNKIFKSLKQNENGDWVYDGINESVDGEIIEEGCGGSDCGDCKCATDGAKTPHEVCSGVRLVNNNIVDEINGVKQENQDSINGLTDTIDGLRKRIDKDFKKLNQIVNSTRTIEIKTAEGATIDLKDKSVHEKFELVLTYLTQSLPVLVYGETGSGKTFMAQQIAEVNGWDYYFCNQVTEEYKLTGYKDANGNYHDTSFFNAFTKGGLFCIDEVDASIPEVIICLNMALANGKFNFPHGQFDMHPEFRVMACANTISGATSNYTGRSKLDKATLDRFVNIEMTYDNTLERKIMNPDTVELLIALREYVNVEKNIDMSFSTRCGLYYDKMKQAGIDTKDLVTNVLLRGVDVEDFKDFGKSSENKEIKEIRSAIRAITP